MIVNDEMTATAAYVLDTFRKAGGRIATAESCTGGLIAALLTDVAGSSDVFDRGFVTYSDEAKTQQISVPEDLIREFGAVSAEVAMAMAQGALEHSNATVSVSVTGIAGPGGGTETKPVGMVFVAVAGSEGLFVEQLNLGEKSREEVRAQTAQAALEMLVAFGLYDEDNPEPGALN